MKVLIVEDHPNSRRNLQRLAESRGHDAVGVGSVEEAEALLSSQSFPFLIVDWMLPGKSGVQFCRELRDRPGGEDAYVLLVTGRANPDDLQLALNAGANDYLIKPFDIGLLNVRLAVAERQIRQVAERNESRAALVESRRAIADILENTIDGFFALDAGWRFTYVNAKAASLLGCSRDSLVGENFWEKFPELCGSLFENNYHKIISEDRPLQFEATDPSGATWYEVNAYPSGNGISVFFRDITERKRTEAERLKTSKLESLGTLAGGIAHDLNNILTVISGNLGLAQIEAGEKDRSFLPYLSNAGEAAQHAAHLSSQLLTFAKGGAPIKQIASLDSVLRHASEFALYGSNLRAEISVARDLWKAEMDRGQIEQVISALMLNAREAMPQGGTVRLAARNLEVGKRLQGSVAPGRYIKVTLSDEGGGISPEIAAKIFDPYFTTKQAGSGLGLSISYSIVRKHGGLLHLESSSPEGSVFAFYLPAAGRKKITGPEAEVPAKIGRFSPQRVLVMDDDGAVRELTTQLLKTLGYEVTAVPDGSQAIHVYEQAMRRGDQFQAVLLDATVRGGLGGVATIERLRELDPHVTAIVCSGYSDEAALSQFLAYGFRGALPKPFTRTELGDVIQRALSLKALN